MFGVAIYAEVPTIVTSGVLASLKSIDDIDLCILYNSEKELLEILKTEKYQILIVTLKDSSSSTAHYDMIKKIRIQFTKIRIIAIAPKAVKDVVFHTIKCGASGFLSSDSTIKELKEAVYTIRGGHEYFSSSITNLIVNNYVADLCNEPDQAKDTDVLGKREIEVLSLWGEGYTNIEIADRLFISVRTVESHKNHIMQKLGIRTTVDLLKFAIRNNIVTI